MLADGRELVYFDEPETHVDRSHIVDRRPLPPATASSTMRLDRLLDEWVAIAGHRQTRTYLPPDDECPLCPSTDQHLSEIPAAEYDVVVFENRFPSFAMSPDIEPADLTAPSNGSLPLFVSEPGVGRCEVVCFTSDHDAAFSSLTPRRVRTVIEAWVDRTETLGAMPAVEQVFCFENRGEEIGVSLSHPHGQIYGYPYVTPRTRRMLDSAREYRNNTGRNLFADTLAEEQKAASRVVVSSAFWTAFVPFAARWPMEVHLYPNRQVPDLPALDDAERDDLSHVYLEVLRRMEAVHDDSLPYIAGWHQAPARADRDLAYLHLEIFSIRRAPGKLKYLAGSESAMGAFVNDVLPEEAARLLREVEL
ncbi:MAG: UDPglucose--hexose-phosphate uridylyltransferase [Actinomycetota bacterium]|jgi:UDPglucose--hexose-1-phosphate uridylyltransferase|nr:UDPglucose--hexose-phosphate uridylyltransferase [Actinomycetota bacterium]